MINRVLVLLVLTIAAVSPPAEAAGKGKMIAQAVQKRLPWGNWGGRIERARTMDLARDQAASARPLAKERVVTRFTSKNQAAFELQHGLGDGVHVTSRELSAGRTPSGGSAMKIYGLKNSPEVREQIRIPQGTMVKFNKVYGGRPGMGEITLAERLPSRAVEKSIPLSPGKLPD